ncbi:MAG: Geranylgeranyl diphosphate synthase [Hyphomicrobiaceae bacterium hypho_1]
MSELEDDVAVLTAPSSVAFQAIEFLDEMQAELCTTINFHAFDSSNTRERLSETIRYSLGLRGKCVRGLLTLLVMAGWDRRWRCAMCCAKAVEMVHTASLIIDDLPSMDNASLRRGEVTNHIKFGEPAAILASISLLSEAFKVLASSPFLDEEQQSLAVQCLAGSVGVNGMSSGQLRDMVPLGREISEVELTHALKTGMLFAAATELGCIAAKISGSQKLLLCEFGALLGSAFQEFDDLIDVATDLKSTDKDTGKDSIKPTIVGIMGLENAEKRAIQQVRRALDCLEMSGIQADQLRQFTLNLIRSMRTTIHSS